ncbi:transporter substrate-binding domain-containing protein [Herbaspirillum sp. RV1423]|uniref:transporter substrate-binding domain-containing protein n=1 Tax=Herbaspirillum sp. RV1423 TaxID=1443993 RepID=UPI0004ADF266|nr:transporter substrate-binding domain-containing protein [Herbaspirillum sp. RV1423]
MKRRSLLLSLIAASLAAIAAPGHAMAEDALSAILARKVIRVAVPTDYPPYGSVGTDMVPRGYDIDMATLVAKKLNVKLELIPVTAPNRIAYLQTKKSDLTISSLGKTPEREKVIDYSIAYAPFFDAVFGKQDIVAKNYAELTGKVISVTRGSMQDEELSRLAPGAVIKRFEDNNGTVSAFLAGQTQMFATGTAVAAAIKAKDPSVSMDLKVILSNAPCYIGVLKGEPQLVAKLNEIIREAKTNGAIDEMSRKWLGAPAGALPE